MGTEALSSIATTATTKRFTLIAVIMGSVVVGIDATVVNVALPTISADLGGGLSGQQWVVAAYLLALSSFLLLGGSLGDRLGERRVFAAGVAGFGVGSVLCALAPSIGVLIAARVVQGLAGALLTPAALAVIVAAFPPKERGGAIGTWAAWSGVATVIGPLAGGEVLHLASWRWVFLVNLPFVALTLGLVPRIPQRPTRGRGHIDWIGAALVALALAGPVFALIEQPRLGWSEAGVLAPLASGAALLGLFLWWERRSPDPMLPLNLFRARNFSAGNLETFALYGGLGAFFLYLVLFLQQVAGYTPLESGLATLPTTVVMLLLSSRFGRLADRLGARLFMGLGPIVAACGALLLQRLAADVSYATDLLPAVLVFSLGLSMTVAPLTATVLAGAGDDDAGIASAVNNTVARVAGLLTTAAVGAVIAAQFSSAIEARVPAHLTPAARSALSSAERRSLGAPEVSHLRRPEADALQSAGEHASLQAFHLALGIVAVLLVSGGLLGLVAIRDRHGTVSAEDCGTGMLGDAGSGAHLRGSASDAPTAAPVAVTEASVA